MNVVELFFSCFPTAWKWTTVNSHCAAVTDFIPRYGSLACNKHPSVHPEWAALSLSVPFIMYILLIKRPHVALHRNPLSRVLFALRLTATATCWNTKRPGFYHKWLAYCAKSLFASTWQQTAGVILLQQAQPRPCLPLWQQIKTAHTLESWISAPMRRMKNAGLVWARGEVNK